MRFMFPTLDSTDSMGNNSSLKLNKCISHAALAATTVTATMRRWRPEINVPKIWGLSHKHINKWKRIVAARQAHSEFCFSCVSCPSRVSSHRQRHCYRHHASGYLDTCNGRHTILFKCIQFSNAITDPMEWYTLHWKRPSTTTPVSSISPRQENRRQRKKREKKKPVHKRIRQQNGKM